MDGTLIRRLTTHDECLIDPEDRRTLNMTPAVITVTRIQEHIMRLSSSVILIAFTAFLLTDRPASALVLTIQQPIVQAFSVQTTVIVPDRGSTFIGKVSRAGAYRRRAGFFPWQTTSGAFADHTSTRAHVWIHDMREMDRQILESTHRSAVSRSESQSRPRVPQEPTAAQTAYRALLARQRR